MKLWQKFGYICVTLLLSLIAVVVFFGVMFGCAWGASGTDQLICFYSYLSLLPLIGGGILFLICAISIFTPTPSSNLKKPIIISISLLLVVIFAPFLGMFHKNIAESIFHQAVNSNNCQALIIDWSFTGALTKERCYFTSEECEKIKEKHLRSSCYAKQPATSLEDCDRIETWPQNEHCRLSFIGKTQNITYCMNLNDRFQVWMEPHFNDTHMFRHSDQFECLRKVVTYHPEYELYSYENKCAIGSQLQKDLCFYVRAGVESDLELCNNINDSKIGNHCVNDAPIYTKTAIRNCLTYERNPPLCIQNAVARIFPTSDRCYESITEGYEQYCANISRVN